MKSHGASTCREEWVVRRQYSTRHAICNYGNTELLNRFTGSDLCAVRPNVTAQHYDWALRSAQYVHHLINV
jgi:hypothetical protein